MLTESQWQHVKKNLERMVSDIAKNLASERMEDEAYNHNFARHISRYMEELSSAICQQDEPAQTEFENSPVIICRPATWREQ